MAKQREPVLVHQAFTFASEAGLNTLIAEFRLERQRSHGQLLALQGRRALGTGKVMLSFRVVEK